MDPGVVVLPANAGFGHVFEVKLQAVMLDRDLGTLNKPIMAQNRSYQRSVWVYNWDVLN